MEAWLRPRSPTLLSREGLLSALTANVFEELRVPASVWFGGPDWRLIHATPNVAEFEVKAGAGSARWTYNGRSVDRVLRTGKAHLGQHAGFSDLFVPVLDAPKARSVLIIGPFALSRPGSADILERWRVIAGLQGRLTDVRFASYVATTLGTLTLEGKALTNFRKLVQGFVELMTHSENPEATFATVERARAELHALRFAERTWESVRNLVDERTGSAWLRYARTELGEMGLERLPHDVVVGLVRGKDREPDPVDELIRRDALQRAGVELARKLGGVACGRAGERGLVFLVERERRRARVRPRLIDLTGRIAALARRFGFKLHAGLVEGGDTPHLPGSYRAAFLAAERALVQGVGMVSHADQPESSWEELYEQRASMANAVRQNPALLIPRFERYIEVVLSGSGHGLERMRADLEAGFERLVGPLLSVGVLSPKARKQLFGTVSRRADEAETAIALVGVYRGAVLEIEGMLKDAVEARHEHAAERAVDTMQERYGDRLSVRELARAAGFAPAYFSKLFKRDQGVSPEAYLQRLRLKHAARMLHESELSIESVAKLCGFPNRSYFHRSFRRTHGVTPAAFRQRRRS